MSADKFSEIFSGLEEAYGTYEIQKQQVNGKQSGQASVLRSPRTAQTWEGHLSGKGPAIGIIPINADNNCKWGCIDIDQYTGFNHKELLDKIACLEKKLCALQSGPCAESEMISLAKLIEKNLHEEALTNEANKSRNCLQYLKQCPSEGDATSSM